MWFATPAYNFLTQSKPSEWGRKPPVIDKAQHEANAYNMTLYFRQKKILKTSISGGRGGVSYNPTTLEAKAGRSL